jgi:hypothetical protein
MRKHITVIPLIQVYSMMSGDKPPVLAVVNAVAAKRGVSTEELPPLRESVDPDALDRLVTEANSLLQIEFQYLEYHVTVTGTGEVEIASHDSDAGDTSSQPGRCYFISVLPAQSQFWTGWSGEWRSVSEVVILIPRTVYQMSSTA